MKKALFVFLIVSLAATCSYADGLVKATIDPLDIGVGTRALGMGKAFVAAANDTNAIFLNPAGLAYTHNWGVTSMYSSLISEITYTTIGIYRSLSSEAIGFGYVGANISGNIFTTYRDPVTNRIVPLATVAAGYSNSVFLFSYGTLLKKYFDFPQADKITFGTSLKLFYQSLKTPDEFFASGHNVDLGFIYKVRDWLSLGLYGQNVLPNVKGNVFSGNLIWNTGDMEDIPSNYKVGLSFLALGESGFWQNPQDLYVNFDVEQGAKTLRPAIFHFGLEWWMYKYLAFRFGIDEDTYARIVGDGVDNNLTFGIGFWYGDFGLDYTYHQYGPLAENITHYFSLSYVAPSFKIERPKAIEGVATGEPLSITAPRDKTVIHKDSVIVSGEVLLDKVTRVLVNDQLVDIATNMAFSATVEVKNIGKFLVKVKCVDKDGAIIKEYPIRLVRLPSFADVPEGYWARDRIDLLAALKVFKGYPDGTFRPDKTISRAELTTLLIRALGASSPEAVETPFRDVKKNHWASYYIKMGVDIGLITGYPDKTFKPAAPLNRAEGVTILARFSQLKEPEVFAEGPFPDVPGRHWAAKTISAAKSAGLLLYLTDKPFLPKKEMPRAEAAEVLSQTPFVKVKEAELFNWDEGFE